MSRPIKFRKATADFVQSGHEPAKAIDGSLKDGWAIHGGQGADRALFLFAEERFGYEGGTVVHVRLRQEYGNHHCFKRFRLSVSDQAVDEPVVTDAELSPDYIVPGVFNRSVATEVAHEVSRAARSTHVARRIPKGVDIYR